MREIWIPHHSVVNIVRFLFGYTLSPIEAVSTVNRERNSKMPLRVRVIPDCCDK